MSFRAKREKDVPTPERSSLDTSQKGLNVGWVERQRNPPIITPYGGFRWRSTHPTKNLLNTNIYTFVYNDERGSVGTRVRNMSY